MSIREIFDEISLSVIQFLEHHEGVSNVQFFELGPLSKVEQLQHWGRKNAPYEIPEDYKSFLFISDGLLLKWNIMLTSSPGPSNNFSFTDTLSVPLGNMHINSLSEVTRIEDDDFEAFSLDSSGSDGRVAFVYCTHKHKKENNPQSFYTTNSPQIWFQDLSCQWHFIANSFTEYFRLLIMHMGLPHWQYAFTNIGLDPISKQWFRFLSPERLAIDMENLSNRLKGRSNQSGLLLSGSGIGTAGGSHQFKENMDGLVDGDGGSDNNNNNNDGDNGKNGGNLGDNEKRKKKKRKKHYVVKLNVKKVSQALQVSEKKNSSHGASLVAKKGGSLRKRSNSCQFTGFHRT